MDFEGNYKELLKRRNLKSTKHRNAILAELAKSELPMTAEDLFLRIKEQGISISMSTVYRVLETLVDKDLATQSSFPDENKAIYEIKQKDHRHHLLCLKCRKMLPVNGCPLEEYEKNLEERFGFSVEGHKLEVFGYCKSCKDKMKHNEKET